MYLKETLLFESGGRSHFRIPSVVATKNGTVIAFCNDRRDTVADEASEVTLSCAIKKPGEDWSEVKTLVGIPGWACGIGSAVYDDITDTVFCTFGRSPVTKNEFAKLSEEERKEMQKRAAEAIAASRVKPGSFILFSNDNGETWEERPHSVEHRPFVRFDGEEVMIGGSCHGSSHGIRLRHGEHCGRLLCPSRVTVKEYHSWEGLKTCSHNNAIYSDDHGLTWHACAPVQAGTGEGTLIELGDGTITYNSRAYYKDQKRYLAASTDGGETWGDFRCDDFLIEEAGIGCNASFIRVDLDDLSADDRARLPEGAEDVTVFVNPRAEYRRNITACVSFNGGRTWSHTKTIWQDEGAYSSLDYSKADGRFYLLHEKGRTNRDPYEQGISMVEFDLEWLLG